MKAYARGALDPRWTRHHTPVVAGFMLATIKVIRKTPGAPVTYDQNTGQYTAGVTDVYTGKARIQPFGIIGDMVVGQDTTSRRLMRVQIDSLNTDINVDDILVVTESAEAPELELFTMEVRGTISSSNPWVTDLVCEADTKHG